MAASKILDAKPAASPLYRVLVDGTSTKTKYLIGYRAVTLLPFAANVRDNSSNVYPNKDIPTDPVPDTVGIRLGETGDEGTSVTETVEIHAEDVYIYIGSYFSWRGKQLVITANRIFAVDHAHSGTEPGSIEFDCSGLPGEDYPPTDQVAPTASKGLDAPPTADTAADADEANWTPSQGETGKAGSPGKPGGAGGKITIMGKLVSPNKKKCELILNVGGGFGGPGQGGGKGGDAGTLIGTLPVWTARLITKEDYSLPAPVYDRWIDILHTRLINLPGKLELGMKASEALEYMVDRGTGVWHTPAYNEANRVQARRLFIGCLIIERSMRWIKSGGPGGNGGSAGNMGDVGVISQALSSDQVFLYSQPAEKKSLIRGGKGGEPGGDPTLSDDIIASIAEYLGPIITASLFQYLRTRRELGVAGPGLPGADVEQTASPCTMLAIEKPATLRDPVQLMMVLQRLKYEFQMVSGTQAYSPPPRAGSGDVVRSSGMAKNFRDSLEWLQSCATALYNAGLHIVVKPEEATAESTMYSQFYRATEQFLQDVEGLNDIFGNSLNLVMNPAVSLTDLKAEIDGLKALEQVSNVLSEDLASMKSALTEHSQTAQMLRKDIATQERAKSDLAQQLKTGFDQYQTLDRTVRTKRDKLVSSLQNFWDKVKHSFDEKCGGFGPILNVVGTVMMFAPHPPTGEPIPASYLVGSGFSMASSILEMMDSLDESEKQNIKKEAIEKRILRIEQKLEGTALEQSLKEFSSQNPEIADPTAADGMLTTILVERKKFETLCDRYFEDYIQSDDLKDLFDDYVETVQNLRNTIRAYATLAVKYLEAKKNEIISKNSLDIVSATNAQFSDPDLDLVYQFYVRSMSEQFAYALNTLYSGIRAFNCMTMTGSDAMADLARLESFDNVTASAMEAATAKLRHEIIEYLRSNFAHPRVLYNSRIWTITAASHRHVLETFQQTRSFSLTILPNDRTRLCGFPPDWYDVRVRRVWLRLVGAKGAQARGDGRQTVDLKISLGTRFTVHDADFNEHDFQFPSPGRTVSMSYSTNKNGQDYRVESGDAAIYETDFQFAKDELAGLEVEHVPLMSPYARWEVSVAKETDVSKVKEIEVRMEVYARTATNTVFNRVITPSLLSSVVSGDAAATRRGPVMVPPFPPVRGGVIPYRVKRWLVKIDLNWPLRRSSGKGATYLSSALARWFGPRSIPLVRKPLPDNVFRPLRNIAPSPSATAIKITEPPNGDWKPAEGALSEIATITANHAIAEYERSGGSVEYQLGNFRADRGGHEGIFTGAVEMTKEKVEALLKDPRLAGYALFNAFPNLNVRFFTKKDSEDMLASGDVAGWLAKNPDAFQRAEENKQPEEGCVVQLTNTSFIKWNRTLRTEKDGRIIYAFQAVVTSAHQLDGVNHWMMIFDPRYHHLVVITHVLIGKHPLRSVDIVNSSVGEPLMATVRATVSHILDAILENRDPKAHIQNTNDALWERMQRFFFIDSRAGYLGNIIRKALGPNVVADKKCWDVTSELQNAVENNRNPDPNKFLETKLADGVQMVIKDRVLDVFNTSWVTGDFRSAPDIRRSQRETATKTVYDIMKYAYDLDKVRAECIARSKPYIKEVVKDIADAGGVPTTDTVWERLYKMPAFSEMQLDLLMGPYLSKDTGAEIADALDRQPELADLAPDVRESLGVDLAVKVTVDGLSAYTKAVTEQNVEQGVSDVAERLDLEAILAKVSAKNLDMHKRLEDLIREKESMTDREEIKRIDREIAEHKKELELLDEEVERTKREVDDARDLRENKERREKERERKEKEERKKWENLPPEHW